MLIETLQVLSLYLMLLHHYNAFHERKKKAVGLYLQYHAL